mmetsp:Transcript_18178/g.51772  ORF Transcript_18178/g.51772 Transcript_18178/m.51772 type:complete len:81 (+) Transcript_18178:45-287(+)
MVRHNGRTHQSQARSKTKKTTEVWSTHVCIHASLLALHSQQEHTHKHTQRNIKTTQRSHALQVDEGPNHAEAVQDRPKSH